MKMDTVDEPIVIVIKGVFKKDIDDVDDYFDDSETSESDIDISPYNEIPQKYTGLEHWPKRTNILCAHCCLSHNNPPVFIPEYFINGGGNVNKDDAINISIYRALLCAFPCGATYIAKNFTGEEAEQKMTGLKFVYKEFTGDDIDYIPLAPFQEEIDQFGGSGATYTVARFQRMVNRLVPISEYLI